MSDSGSEGAGRIGDRGKHLRSEDPFKPYEPDYSKEMLEEEERCALKVQKRWRAVLSRREFLRSIGERRRQLRFFSWPITIFLVVDALAYYIFTYFVPWLSRELPGPEWSMPEWLRLTWWVMSILPGVVIVIVDSRRVGAAGLEPSKPAFVSPSAHVCVPHYTRARALRAPHRWQGIQFSICHAVFFIANLYRATFRVSQFTPGPAEEFCQLWRGIFHRALSP